MPNPYTLPYTYTFTTPQGQITLQEVLNSNAQQPGIDLTVSICMLCPLNALIDFISHHGQEHLIHTLSRTY